MDLLVTDHLTCPRCGPGFGLILLAREVEDRRIVAGRFGCSNCRETYGVRDGFGDLRAPPRRPLPSRDEPLREPEEEETVKLAALLGVTEGPGHLLLVGDAAAHAPGLARILSDVEVVALSPLLRGEPETPGVTRMVAAPGLPFFSRKLRGVVVPDEGDPRGGLLEEAARVVGPGSRVVVLDAGGDTPSRLVDSGLALLLEEAGVMVAGREE